MAHLHEVRDSDRHFVIDPTTRAITNNSAKNVLMQGDHNSEIYTFELPKLVEGHDMGSCNRVEIHYNNISSDKADSSKDFYTVEDIHADSEDPNTLLFSWKIQNNATKYAGALSFRIRFGCVDNSGVWTYKWHTDIFKGITISDGFDNTEAVTEEYADAISAWEAELDALEERIEEIEQNGAEGTVKSVNGIAPDSSGNVDIEFSETINKALAQAKASGEFDGKDGVDGTDGYTPQKGIDYFDGYTPVKNVDYFDGEPGIPGEKGDKGDTGAQGAKGDKGEPGEKGEKGDKGDKGDTGPAGANGTNGKDGADGKSAYQIAQDHGFTGTEAEWLASLKGEAGEGSSIVVDSELSATSTNPVQNKVITEVVSEFGTALEYGVTPRLTPSVTTADNYKFLQVVDGKWMAVDATSQVTAIVNAVLEEALGGDY